MGKQYLMTGVRIRCPFPGETTHGLHEVELAYIGVNPDVHPDTITGKTSVCERGLDCLRKCTLSFREDFIPCEICGEPALTLGPPRCNRCWELESRIRMDLPLAEKIIARLKGGQ